MKRVGVTEDGRDVIGGLFHMHDTKGVPLSVSLVILNMKGCVPDLHGFVLDALAHGWKFDSIVQRVREAVIDVHGVEYWKAIQEKIKKR